ncbi:MAG: MBL fold metallo-hydrolase [Deltaproteobacteria bacterium]|nr:MBL fold metallo-hydrolase [Deltaproteobacteria bacterium]
MTPQPSKNLRRFSTVVGRDIHRITLPLPGPRPGPSNVYLFLGDNVTLLDTGTAQAAGRLSRALSELGLSFSDIDRVVLTHGHIDHYGSAAKIVRATGGKAQVFAHREDTDSIQTGQEAKKRTTERFLSLMGVPLPLRLSLISVFLVFLKMAETVKVDRFLDDGDMIYLGNHKASVMATPGHTRGSVCLFLEQDGLLFAGDTVLAHITPNALAMVEDGCDIPRRRAQDEFYRSLALIEEVCPRVVHPGHGRAMDDLPEIASMYRTLFSERQEKILDLLNNGGQTVWDVARKLFPDIRQFSYRYALEAYLAVSEVFTHAQELEALEKTALVRAGNRILVRKEP